MSPLLIATLGTVGMFVLILLQVPIGIAMGLAGFAGFGFLVGWGPAVSLMSSGPVAVFSNLDLAVIPLFLFMGSFAGVSGLSADIYRLAYALVGHRQGGLALATVGGCAGFSAICGSSIATAATMGRVALPEMLSRGYSPKLATGTIAAGGTLGILIPPSLIMVIYAFLTEQFVITLFVAAVIPALIMTIALMLTVVIVVWRDPASGPAGDRMPWRQRLVVLRQSWGVVVLILSVVLSIYGGVFTVNEAASFGAALSFVFAVARGKLNWQTLWQVTRETANNTGLLYVIIAGASIFSSFLAVSQMPGSLVAQIIAWNLSPVLVIFVLIGMYIILGGVFDELAAMVITLPFVLPLIIDMGYHPIWWGIIMTLTIVVGLVAPPIGVNVFVLYGIAETVPLRTIYWGIVPFFVAMLAVITLLILFPELVMWLPRAAGYNLK
jgi:C4-dicarboxylate transporter DctM subunit